MHGNSLGAKYAAHRASNGAFAVPLYEQGEVLAAVHRDALLVALSRAPLEVHCHLRLVAQQCICDAW